jgi:hypothetical protein
LDFPQNTIEPLIGVGNLTNTASGVVIKGRFLLDTVAGREAYARLKVGAAKGLYR